MMELKDTINMMLSEDYKERFKAEYYQTKIRYEKIKAFNTKIQAARATLRPDEMDPDVVELDIPKHDCPCWVLDHQEKHMLDYLNILELRAVIENIEL